MNKKKTKKRIPWFDRLGKGVRVVPGETGGPRVFQRNVDKLRGRGEGILASFFRKPGG